MVLNTNKQFRDFYIMYDDLKYEYNISQKDILKISGLPKTTFWRFTNPENINNENLFKCLNIHINIVKKMCDSEILNEEQKRFLINRIWKIIQKINVRINSLFNEKIINE